MKVPLAVLFTVMSLCLVRAEDAGQGFTFDFAPGAPAQALPAWMTGEPVAAPAAHATISFPITPPAGDSDLAVTFYFTETAGGFLRVYWAGTKESAMLSGNLYEGIAMANQRTLLIKRSTLSSPGTLNIQSSGPALNLLRIHWEWVEAGDVSVAGAAKDSALIDAAGGVLAEGEVNGAPALPKPDRIAGPVVTAPLTDKPERIEAGMVFVGTLEQAPRYARLEVKMAGVRVGKTVKLSINNTPAGEVALETPGLEDPGYQPATADGAAPEYIGWRKGSVYVQPGLLKAGDNQFQFTVQDATAATPLAVKDLILQLKYDDKPLDSGTAAPAATPSPTPLPDQSPAPPAAPDDSGGG